MKHRNIFWREFIYIHIVNIEIISNTFNRSIQNDLLKSKPTVEKPLETVLHSILPGNPNESVCQICHKTKFADGQGQACHFCGLKSCARCGLKWISAGNQVTLDSFIYLDEYYLITLSS